MKLFFSIPWNIIILDKDIDGNISMCRMHLSDPDKALQVRLRRKLLNSMTHHRSQWQAISKRGEAPLIISPKDNLHNPKWLTLLANVQERSDQALCDQTSTEKSWGGWMWPWNNFILWKWNQEVRKHIKMLQPQELAWPQQAARYRVHSHSQKQLMHSC